MSYAFCSKLHTLSSSTKILKIGEDLSKLQIVKGGNFFETHCRSMKSQDWLDHLRNVGFL